MTEKLYYADSHLFDFVAEVLETRATKRGWEARLDRTAFFPEGGGQSADTGFIGSARVLDVHERDGEIWHLCGTEPERGLNACRVDSEQRLRRMQNHSGEHVFSGLVHSMYGAENVGFHMADECMTIDFDKELSRDELRETERRANLAVRANLPVRAFFPEPAELAALEYRSKKELAGEVRIVEIEGIDRCACCAPHVSDTGEIGVIKLLTAERHRGGVRITLVCGMDAFEDYARRQDAAAHISAALSAKRDEIAEAVDRLLDGETKLKERVSALGAELAAVKAASAEVTDGNICIFDDILGDVALRELADALADKCGGAAAVFSGSDADGYRYVIVSHRADLRAHTREINAGVKGRGGGRESILQGSASASAAEIENFFHDYKI